MGQAFTHSTCCRNLKLLSCLTANDQAWEWGGPSAQGPFLALEEKLLMAPVLGYPDPQGTYILNINVNDKGAGVVPTQEQEGQERMIAYYSKMFSAAETNYCVTQHDLLALTRLPSTSGRPFQLWTDHVSVAWLCWQKEL